MHSSIKKSRAVGHSEMPLPGIYAEEHPFATSPVCTYEPWDRPLEEVDLEEAAKGIEAHYSVPQDALKEFTFEAAQVYFKPRFEANPTALLLHNVNERYRYGYFGRVI